MSKEVCAERRFRANMCEVVLKIGFAKNVNASRADCPVPAPSYPILEFTRTVKIAIPARKHNLRPASPAGLFIFKRPSAFRE